MQADKEALQTAMMARLSEDIAQASVQTKEKRDRLKSARRACQETAAAIQAKVEACANSVDVAVPMHGTLCSHRNCSSTVDQARGHPFLIHGNAKSQARHAGHFRVTVWKQNKLKRSTCESSHESGAGSVVPLHAGCDPRCQGSRNGGTESERADRDGLSTTRTEGRVGCRRTKTPQHLADEEKKDHTYPVAPLTVAQQEHDAQNVRQEEHDVDHMTKQ